MSKQKSYAEVTADRITKTTDRHGWQSDMVTNYIQAQIAVNLALVADCMLEIYGAERRREADMERFILGEEISKEKK